MRRLFGPFFVFAGIMHFVIATLLAVLPANVHMALHPERYRVPGGRHSLYARLPVQLLFIVWARAAGRS